MGTQQTQGQQQTFGCWRYGDTVIVEADYDGRQLLEPKYFTLLKPADNPDIKAAVLAERERCARIAEAEHPAVSGKFIAEKIREGK